MELPKLFHISLNDKLPSTLIPKKPEGSDDESEGKIYTEFSTPRVSFAPTIFHCLQAIIPNVWHLFDTTSGQKNGVEFAAYVANPNRRNKVVTPEELTKKRWVWDAHVTHEYCFLNPIDIYYCGKFLAFVDKSDPGLTIYPYNDKKEKPRENSLIADARFKQIVKFRGEKYRLKFFGSASYDT